MGVDEAAPEGIRGVNGAAAAAPGVELASRGLTLAVAESCTGGLLGAALTAEAGSSAFFRGGVIAYANEAKVRLLGVRAATLRAAGAVSRETAEEMARGARRRLRADVAIGITGIAGPAGAVPGKPVGTVYIALAHGRGCEVRRFRFEGGRRRVREAACEAALAMLARMVRRR